jgi:urease accessory protein
MTPVALVRALHLASTTLPVGAFSYSQGLEWAVEAGTIRSRDDAQRWIDDGLRHSLGRFEAPLVIAAVRAWREDDDRRIGDLNERMLATRETAELAAETKQMGYSLRRWCNDTAAIDAPLLERVNRLSMPAYPIVFAAIAAGWRLDERTAITAYVWGWLENQVNAALKAVPLGQTDGQRILLASGNRLDEIAGSAIERADDPEAWATQCPGLAIASSRHETQYSRLFRS